MQLSVQGDLPREPMHVIFLNNFGEIVAKKNLSLGQDRLTWNGLNEDGSPVASGHYTAAIQSATDGVALDARVFAEGEIEEARIDGDRVEFVLTDGTLVSEDAIKSIR